MKGAVFARVAGLVCLAVVTAGCQVRTELSVDVREDGGGVVAVSVGFDREVMAERPGLIQQLRLDDLRATGWTIRGPRRDRDGVTWVGAVKPFSTPADAGSVLAEIAGERGPLRDFQLRRDRSFGRTRFDFGGTVDMGGGVASFADDELTRRLGGEPFGGNLERRLGAQPDQVFRLKLSLRLPGRLEATNAERRVDGIAVWAPRLSQRRTLELQAASESWRPVPVALVGLGLAAIVAFVVILVVTRQETFVVTPPGDTAGHVKTKSRLSLSRVWRVRSSLGRAVSGLRGVEHPHRGARHQQGSLRAQSSVRA